MDKSIGIKRTQKMTDSFSKLDGHGNKDTLSCRKARFTDVSSDEIKGNMQDQNTIQGVGTFFSLKEARKAIRKFCRAPTTKNFESSITFLAVINVVVTKNVESFKGIWRDKSDEGKHI